MNFDTIIYTAARGAGVPDQVARIIAAQARHETGNYTSRVFKNDNNAFGYKFVGQRNAVPGTAAPASEGSAPYARYKSVQDSTIEMVNWLKRRQREGKLKIVDLNTPEKYAAALKASGYYGAPQSLYATAVAKHLKSLAITTGGAIATALLFAGIFF